MRGISLLAAHPKIQPEDKITLGYSMASGVQGDVPDMANKDYVVTASKITVGQGIFRQELDLRLYIATL
jgi:hypothetical protein